MCACRSTHHTQVYAQVCASMSNTICVEPSLGMPRRVDSLVSKHTTCCAHHHSALSSSISGRARRLPHIWSLACPTLPRASPQLLEFIACNLIWYVGSPTGKLIWCLNRVSFCLLPAFFQCYLILSSILRRIFRTNLVRGPSNKEMVFHWLPYSLVNPAIKISLWDPVVTSFLLKKIKCCFAARWRVSQTLGPQYPTNHQAYHH